MRRLILIRHAKSSWQDPFADDHARPLNARGQRNATDMGQHLRALGYVPDRVVCSDAVRTRQTADLLALGPDVCLDASLYHASPDTMLDILQHQNGRAIALIGHNPGMALFASGLVKVQPDHPRFEDYPTCAVTVMDFDGQIAPRAGLCRLFVVPRDLQ